MRPPSFSRLVLLIALATGVLAQNYTTPTECASRGNTAYYGVYDAIRSMGTTDWMYWCPYWALECAFVYQHCPGVVTCNFKNTDPACPSNYDPSLYGNSRGFLGCTSCSVEVSPLSAFPSIVLAPRITPTSNATSPSPTPSTPARTGDQTAQQRGIYAATFSFTAAIVVSAFISAAVYAQRAKSGWRRQSTIPSPIPEGTMPIPSTPVGNNNNDNNLKIAGASLAFITPVTLLLQFQAISTSGFLSIGYAPLYQYFTLNFSWANLIIPLQAFKDAAIKLDSTRICVRAEQPDGPVDQDFLGLGFVARQYTGDKANLGALAFLSAFALMVIVLILSFLVSLVLYVLTKVTKERRIQNFAQNFPAIAMNLILRLFIFLLGAISTFAFYQFFQPCSSQSLLAMAGFQFTFLFCAFVLVSILVVRTVRLEGDPGILYKSKESGDTQYSRRWSSLYDNFQPKFYYWFIVETLATVVRAAIVSFVQGAGLRQLSGLVVIDFLVFASLAFVRPFKGNFRNIYETGSAAKRLVMSTMMFVYWQGFNVEASRRRSVGTAQITIETLHAAALMIILLVIGGIGAMRGISSQRRMRVRLDEKIEPRSQ